MSYPKIRDAPSSDDARLHSEIDVTWREGDPPQRFCGDNWCTGACGLPALLITRTPVPGIPDLFSKASGSQVAHGRVMQAKRVAWRGARMEVPKEFREWFEERVWS